MTTPHDQPTPTPQQQSQQQESGHTPEPPKKRETAGSLLARATQESKDAGDKRPEAVQYMLLVWLSAVLLEGFHQLLSVALSLMNFEQLVAATRKLAEQREDMTDGMVTAMTYGSVALSAFIALAIVGVLGYMLTHIAKKTKHAGMARRMWFAFSLYFGFRIFFVFLSRPGGASVPEWLFAVDGMVQILIGVLAIMGIIFSFQQETLDYTGELEELRKLEQEQRKRAEEKAREAEAKKSEAKKSLREAAEERKKARAQKEAARNEKKARKAQDVHEKAEK